jgi:hypothetical protein
MYRDPIPLHCLGSVDLADGEMVKPGSFHHHVTFTEMLFVNQLMNQSIDQVYRVPIPCTAWAVWIWRMGGGQAWILSSSCNFY